MNPRHLSLTNEHYTPPDIVEVARSLLGGIVLDPATSEVGARHVRPDSYFTAEDNGYLQQWFGRVLLNPPGGKCDDEGVTCVKSSKDEPYVRIDGKPPSGGTRSSQKSWWFKLASEWRQGRVHAAIFVGFSIEILQVTQARPRPEDLPIPLDFPLCYPSTRLAYWMEKGGRLVPSNAPPHSSVLVYLPPREQWDRATFDNTARLAASAAFGEKFSVLGRVTAP